MTSSSPPPPGCLPHRPHARRFDYPDSFSPSLAMALASPNRLFRNAWYLLRDISFLFLRPAPAGSPAGVGLVAVAVMVAVVVVEVIGEYPGVVMVGGDVVAAASTVTVASA